MMGKNTNNILDAWIMVEHLSEGDISLKDKKNLRLDDLENKDFYGFFSSIIAGADLKKYKNGGFVFYIVFEFLGVLFSIWIYLPLARWWIFSEKPMA